MLLNLLLIAYYLCVLEVDDWNWNFVQDGTYAALAALSLTVVLEVIILTPENNHEGVVTEWHNGMAAFVLIKPEFVV